MPPKPELMNRISVAQVPDTMVNRYEYNSNSTVKYAGYAEQESLTTNAAAWLIYFYTYNSSLQVTVRQSATGAWSNRENLTYA